MQTNVHQQSKFIDRPVHSASIFESKGGNYLSITVTCMGWKTKNWRVKATPVIIIIMRKSRSGDTRFNRRSRLRVSMQVEPDVSVNLAAFFLKNIGLWISDDPAYERRRKVILVYTIWCIMLSSVVIGRDVYFTWFYDGVGIWLLKSRTNKTIFSILRENVSFHSTVCCAHLCSQDILYVVTNALSMMMITVKICMIVIRKEEFINLIVYMQENFWNENYYDFREKEIFENCKRTCAFFVSLVTTIGICAILSYLATPLIGKLKYHQAEIDRND